MPTSPCSCGQASVIYRRQLGQVTGDVPATDRALSTHGASTASCSVDEHPSAGCCSGYTTRWQNHTVTVTPVSALGGGLGEELGGALGGDLGDGIVLLNVQSSSRLATLASKFLRTCSFLKPR